jgi:fructokinase
MMNRPIMVAGIGEILWDVLEDKKELGGAPINSAYHIKALGGHGIPVSTVGDDERGQQALAELTARGLPTECISVTESFETGYVQVTLDQNGVPSYNFPPDTAWDHLFLNKQLLSLTKSFHGVCFGTLAQRSEQSRKAIYSFLDDLPPNALRIYDLNLRQHFYSRQVIETSLSRAHILKLSDEELRVIASMFSLEGSDEAILKELIVRHRLELAVLTRGPDGCLLLSHDERVNLPGIPTAVVDTIGAGDAFTAATALGKLLGRSLADIADHANRLAAYVCTRQGAMPPIPSELKLL